MADQEVKARLTIEKQGEPEVFREAAEGIRSLSSSSADAGPSIAELATRLEEMAAAADELGPVAQGAIREFAVAIREAATASDLDGQREALSRATAAWKTFGAEAVKAADLPAASLKELEAQIEALEAREAELADPLTRAAAEASKALDGIANSAKNGFKGAEDAVAKARAQIDEYKRALAEAKSSGEGVTASQEAELKRLESQYASTVRQVGAFRKQQADAKADIKKTDEEIRRQVSSVRSLEDVLDLASPKLSSFIKVAGGIVGAFTAGYAAGEKLRNILNQLSDGGFDRAAQGILRMSDAAERLVGSSDRAADRIRLLANQKKIFENLGLEGFTQDVDANARALANHQLALKKINDEYAEFVKKLGLSKTELDQQAAALARNVTTFEAANKQLSQQDVASLFKGQIQEVLDAYERLGARVPGAISEIANSWNITSSATEEAANKVSQAASKILENIVGVSAKSKQELLGDAAAIQQAFSNIKIQNLDISQLEKARAELEKVIGGFTAAGLKIPESLQQVAAQFGVFQNQAGLVASASDEAGLSLEQLVAKYGRASGASASAAASTAAHAAAAGSSVAPIQQQGDALGKTAGSAEEAGSKLGAAAEKVDKASESTQGLSAAAKEVSLAPVISEFTQLERVITTAGKAVANEFVKGFQSIGPAVQGFSGPILAELDKIIAKADQAKAALDRVQD